jgi:predicted amidohydrolase YtcJ
MLLFTGENLRVSRMSEHVGGCGCGASIFNEVIRANRQIADRIERTTGWISGNEKSIAHVARLDRRDFLKIGIATTATAGLVAGCSPVSASNTTVFYGGTILTVDEEFSEADAIAVRGNEIIAVGSEAEVQAAAGEDAQTIDLAGKTMLPGFVEPHAHVVSGAIVDAVMENVGMARFGTADEVLAQLKSMTEDREAGEWVVGRNFDPAVQDGPSALTFAELDAVSSEHPIFVLNASGHIGYANRKAFEVAGVADDVANPDGAEFVRDADGNLTGEIKNNIAFMQILGAYPALANADPVEAVIALLGRWGSLGLTTVSDLGLGALSGVADAEIIMEAGKTGRLTARLLAYPFYTLGLDVWDATGIQPGDGDSTVRIAGFKLVADGSNQGFTGLQRKPYLNSDSVGLAYTAAEELKAQAVDRAAAGWHLAIHANGDAGIDNTLDAYEAVRDAGHDLGKVRGRIEHCSILHDEQIERMKDLGITPSFLIGHVHFWGTAMRDTVFGEDKAKLLDRCKSVEEAGLKYSLQSDFMVTDPDPLHMIEMAVTRRTWKEPEYRLAPDEAVSVESAIRAVTSNAAWHLMSDHEVGSLEVGKLADLVILEQDPREVDPDAIKSIKVLETWMDGNQVYSA